MPSRPGRNAPPIIADDTSKPVVIASRPLTEVMEVQGTILRRDAAIGELLLNLVRETAEARNDQERLLEVIGDFAFQAFPSATHHILAVGDDIEDGFQPLIARARSGDRSPITLSRTIVAKVAKEGVAVLVSHAQDGLSQVESIALSGLQTALCAPLMHGSETFGVIQLDIRRPAKGVFTRQDLDLASVFASQVSLALDHLRLFHQQRRAFQSTMSALLHSLTLKDPATAEHSERVQAVALEVGRYMGLPTRELEVLGVAALLHDLGKQGVRDELLFKPGRFTDAEREEMARHAAHTQAILDKIVYPEHLRDVPMVAAYHHEKMDGSGPLQIEAKAIPLTSRIIAVADVFDAMMSPRAYKRPGTVDLVVQEIQAGRDSSWDPAVVRALREVIPDLMASIYAARDAESPPPSGESLDEAA
jgi:HD-GYP domain-containing protein (c-di-GMP phosphodiesterase class II)